MEISGHIGFALDFGRYFVQSQLAFPSITYKNVFRMLASKMQRPGRRIKNF
jgi:hypothetical protein